MSDVRSFGAAGDGQTDDTDAIEHAIQDGDGLIEFPPGSYRISRTIEMHLDGGPLRSVSGAAGTARLVMTGSGPALRIVGTHGGTAEPGTVRPELWQHERFPTISGLEIVGDHPESDGIELARTMQTTIQSVLIRRVRYGVRLSERNRNFLLTASHIYDNAAIGVFIDRCNLHQAIISGCHISYNRQAGIKSVASDLHNLQITGNDIEYNDQSEDPPSAELWFDAAEGAASEITIASNTIQARPSPGGTNLRIHGAVDDEGRLTARLITVTGNVLGSQDTNVDVRGAERVSITGNTIYDGRTMGIYAEDCTTMSIGSNTFGWSYGPRREMTDSVRLIRCRGVTLSGLAFSEAAYGSAANGAALTLENCEDSAVSACQITSPRWRGIELRGCRRCQVQSCSIVERHEPARMIEAIVVVGGADNLVHGNLIRSPSGDAIRIVGEVADLANNVVAP